MAGAETQPNRNISRMELLKSIGKASSIVGGVDLMGVSGKDLYTKVKEDRQRIHEAERGAGARGYTKPDEKAFNSALRVLEDVRDNPASHSEEEKKQADRIVLQQSDYDVEVFRIDWGENKTPHNNLGDKLADFYGAMLGAGAATGGAISWATRQKRA
jgi:hypothetical protein